jgi:hypothetical protein
MRDSGSVPHEVMQRIISLVEQPPPGCRLNSRGTPRKATLRRRRRAAMVLLRLWEGDAPDSQQLQIALARSLALALPARLARPRVLQALLSASECTQLMHEAQAEGRANGWGSLHRKCAVACFESTSARNLTSDPRRTPTGTQQSTCLLNACQTASTSAS